MTTFAELQQLKLLKPALLIEVFSEYVASNAAVSVPVVKQLVNRVRLTPTERRTMYDAAIKGAQLNYHSVTRKEYQSLADFLK